MSKYAFTDTELALRWGGADGVMPEATPENAWKAINAAVDAAKLLKEHVETATHLLGEIAYEEKSWWLIRSLGYSDALEKQVCSALRTCCVLRDNAESSLRVCKEQRKRKEGVLIGNDYGKGTEREQSWDWLNYEAGEVGTEVPCSEDGKEENNGQND